MLAFLFAISAGCAASSDALLDANRIAMGARVASGTAVARYAYAGQGLSGSTSVTFDLATGRFVEESAKPPIDDLGGFDGRTAWFRDLSGWFVPQGVNGGGAVAVSQAYLHAQAWLKPDHGGARIQVAGCNSLRVVPPHGNPFEARFDAGTKLLSSIRQTFPFGVTTETFFADYRRRGSMLVPTRIEIVTEDDPATRETLHLESFELTAARPARAYSIPPHRPSDWSLPPQGSVTVPFRLLNNHVVIDVKVNGKGPFPFLLDTGGHAIVTPATLASLGLSAQGETVSGGSGDGLTTNGYTKLASIDIGGARLADQTVTTLDFSPVAVEGLQLGGMLGLEFLERFVVRIDYGRRTVTIMDRKRFGAAERRRAGSAISFVFYEHMPQIEGSFDGRPARFNIDTGSRSDITLTSPFVEREGLRTAYPNGVLATEGWGVGGAARAYVTRGRTMRLGDVVVPEPIAGLSVAKKGALSDRGYDGNVGSGALKRFIVTFDYAARTMFLLPANRLDPDTGQFDRTGMWLNLVAGGLKVMDVVQGGPAEAAGLRIGDIITGFDGQPVSRRSLSEIRSFLKTAAAGRPLAVDYVRGGQPATARLEPRELIPGGERRP